MLPITYKSLLVAGVVLLCLGACSQTQSDSDLPEPTDESCSPEKIELIKDSDAKRRFIDLCVRRNTFKPSPKREW